MIFDQRQWTRQARTARTRNKAPGNVPLTDRKGRIVIGSVIRAVGHRWQPALTIPHTAMGRHQVIIGSSGSGKTTLMIRTWAGWYTAARQTAQHGAARPLLVVMDCKGGPDARTKAARTRTLLHAAGARRSRSGPTRRPCRCGRCRPRDLAVVAVPDARHRHRRPGRLLRRHHPGRPHPRRHRTPGPPGSAAEFLDRLDQAWLERAYAGDWPRLSAVRAAAKHLPDIALRYRTLLDRLGPGFDGNRSLGDADAWYLILEGTSQHSVASAPGPRGHRAARPCRHQHDHRAAADPARLR